ncbi:methyltransferase domain-containing protein [Paenibacillus campinasensis]|uniref:Methyltransferase domain-containing protein n=1 Tax=Paenibacillus campinasensis TaxID=66347 RepID=A0ABW9SYE9_9BACL|nr:class I SAM-dependent methyltransferase [Paenibacillus campinasensis]MUG66038.1 methyltransferase domain-containing protein [Paenibacillus campinasensis]
MGFLSVLSFAHKLVSERLLPGDIAVDATAGTGADTLFLARCIGPKGSVFAFDIQEEALQLTRQRLNKEASSEVASVSLHLQSHEDMRSSIPAPYVGKVGAIMFNLGYLPADEADKTIITQPETTIAALNGSLELLRPGGIVTIVLYPGHPGGETEARTVEQWAAAIPQHTAQSILYRNLQRPAAPYLIALERRKPI